MAVLPPEEAPFTSCGKEYPAHTPRQFVPLRDGSLLGGYYIPLSPSECLLSAVCGPGESPTRTVIAGDITHPLANSVFVDDPTADTLCGGSWTNGSAFLPPGFPVDETFRNTTFDQPGPVLQGTVPYPELTAGAPINDGAGNGWLRVSDTNADTNGLWQAPTSFSTIDGVTAAVSYASHDGSNPGGDGMAFVFTDGSVAPQTIPVGGLANLGLQNWEGGYIAIVLDETGQTCTCDQAVQGTISGATGPCGTCANAVSIQLAGSTRTGATCACCTIASAPLAPNVINLTTRTQPLRLYTSIITEAGQVYASVGIDWNDGNGIISYFDRQNITACAGSVPATLRMAAYGGSGTTVNSIKELRDASARPAGEIHWRAFPIQMDIPACLTGSIKLTGNVTATFNSDTQSVGNDNPEAYFWLVNTMTNTVVARAQVSSDPSQIGTPNNLTWNTTILPADLSNLRVYIGSESRDESGEYDTLWENLTFNAVEV